MQLRDLQIIDLSHPGHLMSTLDSFAVQIVELYLSHLKRRVQTNGVAKVIVELSPTAREPEERTGAEFITWPFNFSEFDAAEHPAKKHILLNAMHSAPIWAAANHHWALTPFEKAKSASEAAGLIFCGLVLKRDVQHPSSNVKANCYFEYGDIAIDVWVVVRAQDGRELGRVPAFSTPVRYDALRRLVGGLEWVRGTKLRVIPSRLSADYESHLIDVSELVQSAIISAPPAVP